MKYLIGLDIGGTKISIVKATLKAEIKKKIKLKTRTGKAAKKSVREIEEVIDQLIKDAKKKDKLLGIGIGVPGSIDQKKGVINPSPNLPGWAGIPLRTLLKKKFNVPVFIENDANIASLGHKHFGAGKGLTNFIYVTVSTGVGGGIVMNDQLITGASGDAGEIGHIPIIPGGNLCPCGQRGCLEAHASGTAIGKKAQKELKKLSLAKRKNSAIFQSAEGKIASVSGKDVYEGAKKGDPLALKIFDEMGYELGLGFSALIMILNPEAILIGGGASAGYPYFSKKMKKTLRENAWKKPLSRCKVKRVTMGGNVSDIGAISLVLENLGI